MASWYGPGFHGNRTANGEVYDMHKLTAAHRTLPLGSVAIVRSLTTGREVTVRINDRGPFAKGRILDVSLAGAQSLGMTSRGTDEVEIRVVGYQGRVGELGFLRVQVGSFAEAANAQALVDRLKAWRYQDVRIITVELAEGKRYRVQVGRYTTESQAEIAAVQLASQLNLDPFVIREDS
jgi:rare lipoprotein A